MSRRYPIAPSSVSYRPQRIVRPESAIDCPRCAGRGRVEGIWDHCDGCNGFGWVHSPVATPTVAPPPPRVLSPEELAHVERLEMIPQAFGLLREVVRTALELPNMYPQTRLALQNLAIALRDSRGLGSNVAAASGEAAARRRGPA